MLEKLNSIKDSFLNDLKEAKNLDDLERIRVKYFGRKSELTSIMATLKDLAEDKRRELGSRANILKKEIEEFLKEKKNIFSESGVEDFSYVDISKPGFRIELGHKHPLSIAEEEMRQIFLSMNFSVVEGPEIESEFYNFDALNIPASHPAREMWDTFWIKNQQPTTNNLQQKKGKDRHLLRTHTSPMQVRYMEKHNPPFQIIVPGRVFRYEATDFSHEINFYQLEGLVVGPNISLANFKFIVEEFFRRFFSAKGRQIEFRYRPSYFPFTEPSVEVDIRLGKTGKWLEVMGAGMVHRKVFDAVKYDSNEISGFAFGFGVDRMVNLKYGIPDVRLNYGGDLRFIRKF